MEHANQIEVLRARVFASMPSKQRLQPGLVSKQAEDEREEGELSSSDDDQALPSSLPGPLPLRGQPLHTSRLGCPPQVIVQDKIHLPANISDSNVMKTEVALSATNISIVNKSQLLSGLSASAPSLGSLKRPNEVPVPNIVLASHSQGQYSVTDLDSARQHGSAIQPLGREIFESQPQLHGSMKKLSPAVQVYTPHENGSSAGQPHIQGKKRGRSGDTGRVPQGNIRLPPTATPRPFSPLLGVMSLSAGTASQPVSAPAVRTEVDDFLAGLVLPVKSFSLASENKNLIIKFDDSDSDNEQQQLGLSQGQSAKNSFDKVGTIQGKSSTRTQALDTTPENSRREEQRVGMEKSKLKSNVYTKSGSMLPSASSSKTMSPHRVVHDVETLRQQIAAKENELKRKRENELRNRVKGTRLHEQQICVSTGVQVQGVNASVPKVGDKPSLKSAPKAVWNEKSVIASRASSVSGIHTIGPLPSGIGARKAGDAVIVGSGLKELVSRTPLEENAAGSVAETTVLRVTELKCTGSIALEDAIHNPSRESVGVGPAFTLRTSTTGMLGHGTPAASLEVPNGMKASESGKSMLASVSAAKPESVKGDKGCNVVSNPVEKNSEDGKSAVKVPIVNKVTAHEPQPTSLSTSTAEKVARLASAKHAVGLSLENTVSVTEYPGVQHKSDLLDINSSLPLQVTAAAASNVVEQQSHCVGDMKLTGAPSLQGSISNKRSRAGDVVLPSVGIHEGKVVVKKPRVSSLSGRVADLDPFPLDPLPAVVVENKTSSSGNKTNISVLRSKNPSFSSTLGLVPQSDQYPHICSTYSKPFVAETTKNTSNTASENVRVYHVQQSVSSGPFNSSWSTRVPARAGGELDSQVELYGKLPPLSQWNVQQDQSRLPLLREGRPMTTVNGTVSSSTSLQSRQILSKAETCPVVNSSAMGVQVLHNDAIQVLQSTSTPASVVHSMGPDTYTLQNMHKSIHASPDPSDCAAWPALQQFEASGSRVEQLGMHGNVPGGGASISLQRLQEEEDSVDKALEEAQVKRRQCERREREARQAHREAQVALRSANALCEALLQRQKQLSVQVHTAEYQLLQQPSFSIHSNSLVPFHNSVGPCITEISSPAYWSTPWHSDQQLPGQELELEGHERIHPSRIELMEPESGLESLLFLDQQIIRGSPRSVDTVILDENLVRPSDHSAQVSSGQLCADTPGFQEDVTYGQNSHPNVAAHESGFGSEVEVTALRNSEVAASSHRVTDRGHTTVEVPPSVSLQGLSPSRNPTDLQDRSNVKKVDIHKSLGLNEENCTELSGSRSTGDTVAVTMPNGQVEADWEGSDSDAELGDAEVSLSLSVEKRLLKQSGAGASVHRSPEASRLDTSAACKDVTTIDERMTYSMTKRIDITEQETFKVHQVSKQDFAQVNGPPNRYDKGLADNGDQEMGWVHVDDDKKLQASLMPSGSPGHGLDTSNHDIEGASGREHQARVPVDVPLTTKRKREISGLKALADNDETEEIIANKGETIRKDNQNLAGFLEDKELTNTFILHKKGLTAEQWIRETNTDVQLQRHKACQIRHGDKSGEKEDCVSMTSVSSEGETKSDKEGEESRCDVLELIPGHSIRESLDYQGVEPTSKSNSADNLLGPFTEGEVCMEGGELSVGVDELFEEDQLTFELKQLPSTMLSVAFSCLGTKDFRTPSVGYNQVGNEGDQVMSRLDSYESPLTIFRSYRMCSQFQTAWHKGLDSQTWSHVLDPCRPLCKFEHRGKCNNDACPWQHIADYSLDGVHLLSQLSKYMDPVQGFEAHKQSPGAGNSALTAFVRDAQSTVGESISNKSLQPQTFSWNQGSPVPIYKIGSFLITPNEGKMKSRVRCCLGNDFKVDPFSSCILSSAMYRPVHPDIPCLPATMLNHHGQMNAADASCWRYTGDNLLATAEDHVIKEPGDIEAWLDIALARIDFSLNCTDVKAYNEALYVLSRALEANPTVATLWVVYIGLYYQNESEIGTGKDDLFYHAINICKGSYELLLLYINSRTTLTDRLKAYNLALQSLIANTEGSKEEQSACILDVVMQMFDCMCTGKVIPELHDWATDLLNSQGFSKSILACLTSEDCCIMRIACAYAVAFGHLPQNFLLSMGCKQQLPFELDWDKRPQLQESSRGLVLKLMQAGMSCELVLARQDSQQAMAVNYVQCLALCYGIDSALQTGWQLMERYPGCLEIVLLVARMGGEQRWMEVFQQAVQKWPKATAGQQRLWNQYAVHMLQSECSMTALHVLQQCAGSTCESSMEKNNLSRSSSSVLDVTRQALQLNARTVEKTDGISNLFGQEAVFAWLNVALFEMLSGNSGDAQVALEKSKKAAVRREDVRHCWKEMASFTLLSKEAEKKSICIYDLLDRCCLETNLLCKLTPLASRLPASISKRRVRLFLESLIGPGPVDHTLVNSVVEIIIGKEPRVTKDVALIVEAVLDTLPGNLELVLPFCRLLTDNVHSMADKAAAVWASSLLLGSLLQACPQAHEQDWVEAGHLLAQVQDEDSLRSFFHYALTLYPFSATLKGSFALLENASEPGSS